MKEYVFAVFVAWCFCVVLSMLSGSMDRQENKPPAVKRRIDIIVPGYRLGYWLAGPVK